MRTAYIVAPEADAADAVQDGFLKAYAALPRFRVDAPFRPWLLRIVGQRGAQSAPIGGSPGRARDPCGGAIRWAAAVADSPESEILAAETRDQLHAALRELRDEDREVHRCALFPGPLGG